MPKGSVPVFVQAKETPAMTIVRLGYESVDRAVPDILSQTNGQFILES